MPKVLAIDDDVNFLQSVRELLQFENYEIDTLENPLDASAILYLKDYDCILLDVKMPGMDGLSLLETFVKEKPEIPVIMISGQSTLTIAVEAIKMGAYDFLEKGADLDRLLITLQNATERKNLYLEKQHLLNEITEQFVMVGHSQEFKNILNEIEMIAPTEAKVLISGETGTGKELVARAIHLKSKRSARPYIKVNCAAIPETLIESTFFGHVKGSFTGAVNNQMGKFEQADGGTLFLDEIAELPIQAQSKLLRVLESGEIEKIGSRETRVVNVRIISATNKDLPALVKEGKFREDLYHRLVVYQIQIPPLRKRKTDIPVLAHHFLKQFSEKYNKPLVSFTSRAMDILINHEWSGNVRMLSNVIERVAIISNSSKITPNEIMRVIKCEKYETDSDEDFGLSLQKYLEFHERDYLRRVLNLTDGNKAKAARILQLDRATLWRKLVKHGLINKNQQDH